MRSRNVAASGPDDFDLAERGAVEQSDACAGRAALARDGVVHGFASLRKIPGALPLAHILERGAVLGRPFMNGRAADGIEHFTARGAGECAEADRRVGRPEGGETHLGNRLLELGGGDGKRVHVGKLALVGRHAGGGVALDVLDRAHALLDGQAHILGANVVLEIDEGFRATVRGEWAERWQRGAERGKIVGDRVGSRREARRSRRPSPPRVRLRRLRRARPQDRRSHCRRRPTARAARTLPA